MSFQPVRLKAKNFLCFPELDLKFRSGITLILGDNQDNTGSNSNGAGKSAIWDAMVWSLFGRTIRGLSSDEVVRDGEKMASASLEWMDVEGREWRVVRSRAAGETALVLERKGKNVSAATPTQTQTLIELAIGHDSSSFISSVLFGQDVTRWAFATDKEQKLLLERLLGLSFWEALLKDIRRRQQGVGLSLQLKEASIEKAKQGVADLRERQGRLKREEEEWQEMLLEKTKKLERRKKDNENSRDGMKKALSEAQNEQQEAQHALMKLSKDFGFEADREEKRKRIERRIVETEALIAATGRQRAMLKEAVLKVGKPCPTCRRTLDEKSAKVCSKETLEKISELDEKVKEAEDSLKQTNGELKKLGPVSHESFKRLQKANDIVDAAKDLVREIEGKLSECGSEDEKIDFEIRSLEQDGEKFSRVREELQNLEEKYQKTIKGADKELEAYAKDRSAYEWIEKACSQSGIRSYLLDSTLPRLEEWANHYLKTLAPGTRISLSAQSKLASGDIREKLSFTVKQQGKVRPYLALSMGQRQRVDVCIALALQKLASERSNMAIAIFDEVFERLDAEGCERAAALLSKIAKDVPSCYIVTHNDTLKSLFPRTLTVRMKDEESCLV